MTSNRDPSEWIAVMSDPLLAQSAVDRLVSTSYELVIEGESYRRRQRPHAARAKQRDRLTNKEKQVTIILLVWWSLAAGKPVVPSRWQATIKCSKHNDTAVSCLASSTAGQRLKPDFWHPTGSAAQRNVSYRGDRQAGRPPPAEVLVLFGMTGTLPSRARAAGPSP